MNFTKIYTKYRGLWIALDEKLQKVIASDKSGKKVYEEAKRKGVEKPALFKVPKHNLPYIGFSTP